jgi:hypothetical protein
MRIGHLRWHLFGHEITQGKRRLLKYGGRSPPVKDVVIVVVYLLYTGPYLGYIAWDLFKNLNTMMTIILLAAGLICFRLFYKSIDWFEKI